MFLNILKVQDSSQQKIICPKLCPNLETLPHSCSHTDVYRHVEDTKIWGGGCFQISGIILYLSF